MKFKSILMIASLAIISCVRQSPSVKPQIPVREKPPAEDSYIEELENKLAEYTEDQYEYDLILGEMYYFDGDFESSHDSFVSAYELCDTEDERLQVIADVDDITTVFRSDREYQLYYYGFAAIEADLYDQAIEFLQRALEINPGNSRMYYQMGYAQVEAGNFKSAIEYYNDGMLINPFDVQILSELMYCYVETGKTDEAEVISAIIAYYYGGDPEFLHEIGVAYIESGQNAMAIILLERNIELFPSYAPTLYILGKLYTVLELDSETAVDYFTRFIEEYESNPDDYSDFDDMDVIYEKALEYLTELDTVESGE